MKKLILIFSFAITSMAMSEALVTPSLKAIITKECAEGEVTCDKVRLELIDNPSNITLRSIGKTLHSTCADGQTLCAFQGYEFYNRFGETIVYISSGGEITIQDRQGKATFRETGAWQ